MNNCNACGYEWTPIKENPKACPNCKRYDWKTKGEPNPQNEGNASNINIKKEEEK